jgi:hypothetical protein
MKIGSILSTKVLERAESEMTDRYHCRAKEADEKLSFVRLLVPAEEGSERLGEKIGELHNP